MENSHVWFLPGRIVAVSALMPPTNAFLLAVEVDPSDLFAVNFRDGAYDTRGG